jgi:hypothetical protein
MATAMLALKVNMTGGVFESSKNRAMQKVQLIYPYVCGPVEEVVEEEQASHVLTRKNFI